MSYYKRRGYKKEYKNDQEKGIKPAFWPVMHFSPKLEGPLKIVSFQIESEIGDFLDLCANTLETGSKSHLIRLILHQWLAVRKKDLLYWQLIKGKKCLYKAHTRQEISIFMRKEFADTEGFSDFCLMNPNHEAVIHFICMKEPAIRVAINL